jgi:hypothetical protein
MEADESMEWLAHEFYAIYARSMLRSCLLDLQP